MLYSTLKLNIGQRERERENCCPLFALQPFMYLSFITFSFKITFSKDHVSLNKCQQGLCVSFVVVDFVFQFCTLHIKSLNLVAVEA